MHRRPFEGRHIFFFILQALWHHIYDKVLLPLDIHEFFSVDVDCVVAQFRTKISKEPPSTSKVEEPLEIIQDPQYRRLQSTVDLDLAAKIYNKPM